MKSIGIDGAGQIGKMIALKFSGHGFPVILLSHERKLSFGQLNNLKIMNFIIFFINNEIPRYFLHWEVRISLRLLISKEINMEIG